MLANIVLALIIWLLAKGILIFPDATVNYLTWAVIIFVIFGVFSSRISVEGRNYWLW